MAFLSKNSSVIGIDIGSSSVKFLQLNKSKSGQWSLAAFGKEDLPPEAIVDGSVMNTGVIVEAIKGLLSQHRVKNRKVVASVFGNAVIIKRISLQAMSLDELEEVIQWEAEQYIPFDISDVNIDVQILEGANPDPGQMDVLLVAARRDLVNEQMSLLQQSGLSPVVIDVDSFAVANMFAANYDMPAGTIALVNIGAANVNIHILREGISVFTRDINMGGRQFTEEIQRTFNISYEEAEKMKVGGDDSETDAVVPQEIEEILLSVGESISAEIQRSLDFYQSTSTDGYLDQIFVSGGAARTPGLIQAIQQQTGFKTDLIDPFRKIQVDERAFKPSFLNDIAPQFAVAVGLAMRTANSLTETGQLIAVNLLPQRQSRRFEQVKGEFNKALVLLLALFLCLGGVHYMVGMSTEAAKGTMDEAQRGASKVRKTKNSINKKSGEKSKLSKEIDALEKLKKDQTGPVRMMDELAINTPEKLQIIKLTETRGDVRIEGLAATNQDISRFTSRLEKSDLFKNAYINAIEQIERDGEKLKSFSLKGELKTAANEDEDDSGPKRRRRK
jgi:type IV pilus assembly protein PilM